jgi:peroxiredoxin
MEVATMRSIVLAALSVLVLPLFLGAAFGAAVVGQPAPPFHAKDASGGDQSLEALKGKWVVLEWVNFECPFVKKHYGSGNMQALQKDYTGKGVAWLSINSSASGKQGYYAADVVAGLLKERGASPTAYLLDADGTVGHAYGAKTTPHMFVIDPQGRIVYAGGIDDKPSTEVADVKTAKNYVRAALDEAMAGRAVTTPTSTPYGCAVKY